MDFDDLLLLWQAALADPAAGPVLRGMFDAVLVDEYQDVNAVQASIVRLLQPDGKQLTCVGDDAQAIYGFRGADPAHLRQLAADYPGLDIVRLDRNYRSRQGVLDLANLIRPSAPGLDLTLTGDRGPGSPPLLVRCHDEATQAREICARVLEAHEDGTALRDQAVLVRAGHHSDILEIELSRAQDPVREIRRPEVHRHRARQGLPGRRADPGQPRRRAGLVPAAAPARRHRPGPRPPRAGHRVPRHGSGPPRTVAGRGRRGRARPVQARADRHAGPAGRRRGRSGPGPGRGARERSWTR